MISRLFKEEIEVFSWNVFEKKQKKSGRLKGTVEGHNVWVKMQGLVDMDLMMKDEKNVHIKKRNRDKITSDI